MLQTAVVVGASGLIGGELVSQLAQCSAIGRVVTITRRELTPIDHKVENHVVDFAQLERHGELFKADLLFCCLGTTKKQVGSLAAQRIVDVKYPVAAATIALSQGVKHCLVVSSTGADLNARSQYLVMKGELEASLKALAFERISIFRPSLLIGTRPQLRIGELVGGWLLTAITLLPPLKRYRPIHGSQVATKMLQVSQSPGELGVSTFELDQVLG